MLYLLHFQTPYKHARHYLGYTRDGASLPERLKAHQNGQGARLMAVVRAAGINFALARTLPGDRGRERYLKRMKFTPRLCPICRGTAPYVTWNPEGKMPQSAAEREALLVFLRSVGVNRRISILRSVNEWTQEELAAKLREAGMRTGRRTVAGWEAATGKRGHKPGPRARRALAEVFKLPESEMFAPAPEAVT